ncbi:MAG: TetR/AcrR family transcriptional regulator [Alphaproteobacteria bacterium]
MTVRTRKPAAERKAEIVDTAIRLAAKTGPDRLTTEQLADEIGISQPAIFRHFKTKNDIWQAVGQRICDLMGESGKLENKTSPVEKLRSLTVSHIAFIEATPAVPAILFSQELHSQNETLRAFFANLMAMRQKKLAKLIQAGIDTGELKKSINADDAAYLILAIIQGLAMRWSLNNRKFDLVSEGEKLLDLLITGFEKSKV